MFKISPQAYLHPTHFIFCFLVSWFSIYLISCNQTSPAAPENIRPNIIAVPTSTSTAYILVGPEHIALINSGGNPEATEIIATLNRLNRDPKQVRAIFTTSPHRDLNAGLPMFPRAITYTGLKDHRTMMADKHPKALLPRLNARMSPRPKSPSSIHNVYPGDHLRTLGFKFDVVGAPGVSKDSMLYIFEGILFTGKSLLVQDGELHLAPRHQVASRQRTIQSLARLAYSQFDTIADAYGRTAAAGPQDVSKFLDSLR